MTDLAQQNLIAKPKALFIRHKSPRKALRRQGHDPDEFTKFLSCFFDTSIQNEDFDLAKKCDEINPELIIYEALGGDKTELIKIDNPRVNNGVLRIGFMNDDPHDTCRVRSIKFLHDVGVANVFSITSALGKQSPELFDAVFSIPHLFDPAQFNNFGHKKTIPVSIFGYGTYSPMYDWRTKNLPHLLNEFPTLVYRHPGYGDVELPHRFSVTGKEYGELLNQSYFSLADGTRSAYCVRKHIEIPASLSVLVSPEFDELKQYGFEDMKNCIMGTGKILLEKIAALAADRELYQKICWSGFNHVHKNYDYRKNNLVFDWFEAEKNKAPGSTIIQKTDFGGFFAIKKGAEKHYPKIQSKIKSEYEDCMITALSAILTGQNIELAEEKLLEAVDWCHYQEPWLLLGLISVLKGDCISARERFLTPYQIRLKRDGQASLDPVEACWMWFVSALSGDDKNSELFLGHANSLPHVSCRRFNKLLQLMEGQISQLEACDDTEFSKNSDIWSIHWLGAKISFAEWRDLVLRAIKVQQRQVRLATAS